MSKQTTPVVNKHRQTNYGTKRERAAAILFQKIYQAPPDLRKLAIEKWAAVTTPSEARRRWGWLVRDKMTDEMIPVHFLIR